MTTGGDLMELKTVLQAAAMSLVVMALNRGHCGRAPGGSCLG